jgi:hypothetical protein
LLCRYILPFRGRLANCHATIRLSLSKQCLQFNNAVGHRLSFVATGQHFVDTRARHLAFILQGLTARPRKECGHRLMPFELSSLRTKWARGPKQQRFGLNHGVNPRFDRFQRLVISAGE